MASSKQKREEELEKMYQSVNQYGPLSKYWGRLDEIVIWLAGLEEYEKCAELMEIKEASSDNQ